MMAAKVIQTVVIALVISSDFYDNLVSGQAYMTNECYPGHMKKVIFKFLVKISYSAEILNNTF